MKEIDFLPGWYKTVRKRQSTYRTQYVALTALFLLMLVSNFVTSRSISKAQAGLENAQSMEAAAKNISAEYARVISETAALQKKAGVLQKIDSRINIGDVLAELSFLTGKKIVLNRVELIAEKLQNQQASGAAASFAVRPAGSGSGTKEELPGDVRFKIVLGGIAGGASEVGKFVCRLEDSPYFCTVYPAFTRNKQIRIGSASSGQVQSAGRISREQEEGIQLNEFEIDCYLANFVEK